MAETSRMTGIVFSDLGQASSFMALDWVQELLKQCLGYNPFPATLNLRPRTSEDIELWQRAKMEIAGMPLTEATAGHCGARLFRIEIHEPARGTGGKVEGAILLPEVKEYPKDKIEIVAPMRLKDHFGIRDGDALTLEFLN
jgi:CTP-dependent riboflavin kinase